MGYSSIFSTRNSPQALRGRVGKCKHFPKMEGLCDPLDTYRGAKIGYWQIIESVKRFLGTFLGPSNGRDR